MGLQASISSLVKFRTPAFSSDGARVGNSRRQALARCPAFSAGTVAVLLCWLKMLEPVRAEVETRPLCAVSNLIYACYNQRGCQSQQRRYQLNLEGESCCPLGNNELQDGGLGRCWRSQVLQCQALHRQVLRL